MAHPHRQRRDSAASRSHSRSTNQEGRRFSGKFSSSRGTEAVIAVISQSGAIYMVDDDGYSVATILAPNRLEVCYVLQSPTSRVASCTEFTKQP
jgi:tRNA pseudouridine-54 N-methylase